jgi:predicted acetyltransferase
MQEIKRQSEDDVSHFALMFARAYPGVPLTNPDELERLRQRMLKAHRGDPLSAFYGLYRDGRLVGGMKLYDYRMQFRSARVPTGGLGNVAVDLLHKKEKIARDMVQFFLQHYREKGAPLTALYPFRPDFYRQMGYGYGTTQRAFHFQPLALPRMQGKPNIRYLGASDRSAFNECYLRYLARTHGMIEKTDAELDDLFQSNGLHAVGCWHDGELRGYVLFRFRPGAPNHVFINDMVIREMVWETREALNELTAFLSSQSDQIARIVYVTQDPHFHHWLRDPRLALEDVAIPASHPMAVDGIGIMYRLVDVRKTFELLQEHDFAGQTLSLRLDVRDDFLPENAGPILVRFDRGRATLPSGGQQDVVVSLDVREMTSLLMGTADFEALVRYGLADIDDPSRTRDVSRLFGVAQPPQCTTYF